MSTSESSGGGDREPDATEIDASFAAIVAGWGSEEPSWPSEQPAEPDPPEAPTAAEDPIEDPEDEGHYIPPEPPPIPRPRAVTTGALIMLGIGLVLLFIPGVIGLSDGVGLPLGLIAVASGLFWLFLLLRTGPPIDSGWDDGSQL